jgi:hypothetical protein
MTVANKFRIKLLLLILFLSSAFFVGKVEGEVGWAIALGLISFFIYIYILAIEEKCNLCGCCPSECTSAKSLNPYTYMLFTGCCPCCKK